MQELLYSKVTYQKFPILKHNGSPIFVKTLKYLKINKLVYLFMYIIIYSYNINRNTIIFSGKNSNQYFKGIDFCIHY